MEKVPMTEHGYATMQEEVKFMKSEERPRIIRAIEEARAHGDLSENAEYHAARDQQSFMEGRIQELEEIVSAAEVIDPSSLSGDTVKFGAMQLMVGAKTLRGCVYGSTDPARDFPEIVRLQQAGRLDLDALVTRRIALDELNDAFRAMQAGEVARSIIIY